MRILEISTSRIFGGGEIHLRALCFGLLKRGHDVIVACPSGSPAAATMAGDGLPVVPLADRDGARVLARLAVGKGVDVFHAHQSKGARLAVAARYLAGGPRAVLTRHALGALDDDLSRTGLARIIAVSRAAAADCLACGFVPEKLAVVPNGVDLTRFRPGLPCARGRLGLPPGARAVVLVSRLSAEKGSILAMEALLPLLAYAGLYLIVLGDGAERPRLERKVQRAGAVEHVLFLGHQPDVRPFLALAEVVITPGPREAFGLATLEAMAMGRAVVAVAAGGVPEIATDGRDGLLVPPGNRTAMAAAVYRLVRDAELRRRLEAAARERAMEFAEERMVAGTEEVLTETLDQGQCRIPCHA